MAFEIGGETFGVLGGLLIAAIFFLAGLVKGAAAFGVPLVAVPPLALLMPFPTAAAVVIVSIVVSNFVQVVQTRDAAGVMREIWPLYVALPLTLYFSSRLITDLNPAVLLGVVGLLIELFVVLHVVRWTPAVPPALSKPLLVVSGVVGGIVGGATSFYAFPTLQLFLALRLAPAEFVFAAGAMFIVGSAALGAGFTKIGLYQPTELIVAVAAVAPLLVGQQIGLRLMRRGSPTRFRRVVLVLMAAMGLSMIVRGLSLGAAAPSVIG